MFFNDLHCNLSQANIMIHPGKINYCLEKCQSILICNSNMSLLEQIVKCLGYEVFSELLYNFIIHSRFFSLFLIEQMLNLDPKNCFKQLFEQHFAITLWEKRAQFLLVIASNSQDLKLELQQVSEGHLSPQLGNVTNCQNQLDVLGCYQPSVHSSGWVSCLDLTKATP